MPEPPRGARFQIHLSTAIVLMFVAGALIWANVNEREYVFETDDAEFYRVGDVIYWFEIQHAEHGWPFYAVQRRIKFPALKNDKTVDRGEVVPSIWRTGPIIYNALIALAILDAVWFLCEWQIRRRAARNKG